MNRKKGSRRQAVAGTARSLFLGFGSSVSLALGFLLCTASAISAQQPVPQSLGIITGTIVDQTGAAAIGARVTLTRGDQSPKQDVLAGDNGQFSFTGVAPGPFALTITSAGFATQTYSGVLQPGEASLVPPITLRVATEVTKVTVGLSQTELAEVQIKEEEKQRVLGVFPNFYVSYVPDAAPLSPKQKFELAWRSRLDPVDFGVTAAVAGLEQAENVYSGYGQGAEGYGKRYGAAYADSFTSTFIGGAILPSILKQDPRYFYKGTGSTRSRLKYAIANAVICKGDNGRWQPNYSYLLGDLSASGLSNLYYPDKNRGAGLTFENAAIGIGATVAGNIIEEFLIRKFTSNAQKRESPKS